MTAISASMSPATGSAPATSAPPVAAQYDPTWASPARPRSVGLMAMAPALDGIGARDMPHPAARRQSERRLGLARHRFESRSGLG